MPGWILLFTLSSAAPVDAPDMTAVWHHYNRDRYDAAARLASEILREDPSNLNAHRGYLVSLEKGEDHIPAHILATYRSWHTQDPEDAIARFAYAASRHTQWGDQPCEEILPLLAPLPEEAVSRYAALRISERWHEVCKDDRAEEITAQFRLDKAAPPPEWTYALVRQARAGDWDVVTEWLPTMLEQESSRASTLVYITDESKDKRAKGVAKTIASWASGWRQTQDPPKLYDMYQALAALEKPTEAARKRLDEMDPPGPSPQGDTWTKLMEDIADADRKPTHESALVSLAALDKKLPATGDDRMYWYGTRMARLKALGREDDVYALKRDMVRADPDQGAHVNSWAYEASKRGEDLDEAIAAMERVLPSLDSRVFDGSTDYEAWMADLRGTRSAWEDTYGWLLFQAGRHDEAVPVLLRASQYRRDATVTGHTGLALLETGDAERAWPYLLDASIQEGGTGEEALDADILAAITHLWPTRGIWHPGGMDGWLSMQREAAATPEVQEEVQEVMPTEEAHELIGQSFPYTEARALSGGTLDLSTDGIMVVDIWATWCGPCVQGMPHLQEVAESYADRGVRVVGLSVDDSLGPVKRFYKGVDLDVIAYELGHVGDAGFETLKIDGIPALFVVGKDGKIVTKLTGYAGSDDRRLEEALDALLGT